MALFGPESWFARTGLPGMVATPRTGYRAPGSDLLWVWCDPVFVGGPGINEQAAVGQAVHSPDRAFTWFLQESSLRTFWRFWSIPMPDGTHRYFRVATRFGRNFFASNSEIFPGDMRIEWSSDGGSWSALQDLYTWNHTPNVGGAQAQQAIMAHHVFQPGSGPLGADADWLFTRCRVESGAGVVVNALDAWRSDNFGETWIKVGPMTGLTVSTNFIDRGPSGRLVAENASMFFSDNFGLTWNGAGGVLPGQGKAQVVSQAGGTRCVLMASGLGSQVITGVSCDDGASWTGGGTVSGAANSNGIMLRLGPSEILAFARDSDLAPTGVNIMYSIDGGESFTFQGKDTRWPALQSSVVFTAILETGHPIGIGLNNVVLACNDRPTGNFGARTSCPLAFANLRKAGIPNLCGHPLLQNRC